MDANAKVGKTTIKNDPHETSNNGRILLELVERQKLTIENALDTCKENAKLLSMRKNLLLTT